MNKSVILSHLLALNSESELVEFKEAKNQLHLSDIGKYFSALSNEANLKNCKNAWLVFGVNNSREVVGSNFCPTQESLNELKKNIADQMSPRISFLDIYEIHHSNGRVLLFEIPPAPKGIPIAFQGHYYGRDGSSLSPLNIEELERIRVQTTVDWSAEVVADAEINDLDPAAIILARNNFKKKFPDKADEVDQWDTMTFLNKAKLTKKGKLTRTALLLLGKEESEHFLQPADPKIRWILKDSQGNDRDYKLFFMPFLLAVEKVYGQIRNLKYRYIPNGTLFPEEIDQYEPYVIREALNNCIAHQDYTLAGRINVVEQDDRLTFTNLGSFVPESIHRVVMEDAPEEHYRNRFLASAMFNLNMVDTAGGGIKRIFQFQQQRFFPLPDYDLSDRRVKLSIIGKVLDQDYAAMLAKNHALTLDEIIALDKVQKKIPLTITEEKLLRKTSLIEGRRPNFFIAKNLAQTIDRKADYSKNKAFDKLYYFDLICKAITEHEFLSRKDIDGLLWSKLSDRLSDLQKKNKIGNLINELRIMGKIKNTGSMKTPSWVLVMAPKK